MPTAASKRPAGRCEYTFTRQRADTAPPAAAAAAAAAPHVLSGQVCRLFKLFVRVAADLADSLDCLFRPPVQLCRAAVARVRTAVGAAGATGPMRHPGCGPRPLPQQRRRPSGSPCWYAVCLEEALDSVLGGHWAGQYPGLPLQAAGAAAPRRGTAGKGGGSSGGGCKRAGNKKPVASSSSVVRPTVLVAEAQLCMMQMLTYAWAGACFAGFPPAAV